MRFCVATAVILSFASQADAQITLYGLPVNIGGAVAMSVVTEGNALKMDSQVVATLRNVGQTLSAAVPKLNEKTRCPRNPSLKDIGVVFSRIQLSSPDFFTASSGLNVTGDFSAEYCKLRTPIGRSSFSLPMSVTITTQRARLQKTSLLTGRASLQPFNETGIIQIAYGTQKGKRFIEDKVNNSVSSKVRNYNRGLQGIVNQLANQKAFNAFNTTIELERMEMRGDDLVLQLHLTGQLSGKAVSTWIENGQPTQLSSSAAVSASGRASKSRARR